MKKGILNILRDIAGLSQPFRWRGAKRKRLNEEVFESLFERIDEWVRSRKVYLDEDYTLLQLCSEIGTNRSYVSKAINDVAGKTFRQFLNSYRVKYAEELMRKDRTLMLKEVSRMSGFRSQTTFNSAFRDEKMISPKEFREYLKEMKEGEGR